MLNETSILKNKCLDSPHVWANNKDKIIRMYGNNYKL